MNDDHILSVSALTTAIRQNLEGAFPFVWVRGQVVNLSRPSSGHVYFSLRDEHSSLAAVWFKNSQKAGDAFDPLTGEVYEDGPRPSLAQSLENGQEIVCAGRIAVYEARGVYQIIVELAQKAGIGRLHEEFERLRTKLLALGYFDAERKRPLPENPRRIAVITAPQGAAIHDFLRIADSRGLSAHIRIFPAPVQGDAAPEKIVAALNSIYAEGWAELVVLIRGGGSIEDLWAFNDEKLASTIFTSPIPILAGIGHEVDFTLADMTADLRAATPTHAAQLLWPARDELMRQVQTAENALESAGTRSMRQRQAGLDEAEKTLAWHSPLRLMETWKQRLASAARLLGGAGRLFTQKEEARLAACTTRLSGATPAIAAHKAQLERLETGIAQAAIRAMEVSSRNLHAAELGLAPALHRLPPKETACRNLAGRLELAGNTLLTQAAHKLETHMLRLEAVSPLAPLERGYALARREDGSFLKFSRDAAIGEALHLILQDGEVPVRVLGDNKT